MKKLALTVLAVALAAAAAPALAQPTASATTADLQRLQDDLANLDDSLAALEPGHPRAAEFQRRADDIRTRVDRLSEQMQRYRPGSASGTGVTRGEVQDLRRDIANLQHDIDAALGRRFSSGSVVLPEGTEIQVRLEQPLSSATARPEDRFEATVAVPVRSGGRVVIPAGTRVRGIVTVVEPAERPAKGGRLDLTFDSIYLDDRTRTDLRTRVVSVKEDIDITGDAGKRAGIGAVLGGVLGKIIGGTKGALVGILVGGGGGLASSKGQEVELPAGTILTLRLERPLEVRR